MDKAVSTNSIVVKAMKAMSVRNAGNGVTIYGIMDLSTLYQISR